MGVPNHRNGGALRALCEGSADCPFDHIAFACTEPGYTPSWEVSARKAQKPQATANTGTIIRIVRTLMSIDDRVLQRVVRGRLLRPLGQILGIGVTAHIREGFA